MTDAPLTEAELEMLAGGDKKTTPTAQEVLDYINQNQGSGQ